MIGTALCRHRMNSPRSHCRNGTLGCLILAAERR
jgi:hypothetical protein